MTPTLAEALIADTVPSLRTTRRGKYTGCGPCTSPSRTRPLCGCSDRMTQRPASPHLLLHPDDGVRAWRARRVILFRQKRVPGRLASSHCPTPKPRSPASLPRKGAKGAQEQGRTHRGGDVPVSYTHLTL